MVKVSLRKSLFALVDSEGILLSLLWMVKMMKIVIAKEVEISDQVITGKPRTPPPHSARVPGNNTRRSSTLVHRRRVSAKGNSIPELLKWLRGKGSE